MLGAKRRRLQVQQELLTAGPPLKSQLKERIGTADNKGLGLKIRSLVSVSPTELCFKRLDLAETCGQKPGSQGVSLMPVVWSLASNLQANDNDLVMVPETDVDDHYYFMRKRR